MEEPAVPTDAASGRSLPSFLLLLFGLSIPIWVIGALHPVEIFPGFRLYQATLAMPAVAALILTAREGGKAGVIALLKRTYDFRQVKPRIWFLPILLIYPSFGLIDYWVMRLAGADIPAPHFSLAVFLGYCTVFFMTYGEELGLTGYAIDPLQRRHGALASGLFLGAVWAAYHVPIFVISGFFSREWIFWHAIYTIASRVLFVWVYNNAGGSLFSMALQHWTFGLFWSLWPQENLHRAVPFYDPRITAIAAIAYVAIVTLLWGPRTLAASRPDSRSTRP
jgi:membrane protease YdiL (CAAX protease family)